MIIEIENIPIELILKPIKSINIRIYPPDGRVKVTAPLRYNKRLIHQHIQNKIPWIKTQQQRMQSHIPPEEFLQTGANIPFMGKNYLLVLKEHNGPNQIVVEEHLMICYAPLNPSQTQLKNTLKNWYQREMQQLIPQLIQKWEPIIGVKVREFGIKQMKTRWGSCNTLVGRIWLNLNLVKKPISCLEYVLVHELVHLLEPSHNSRFYALMSTFLPQWREVQFELEGKRKITAQAMESF